MRAFKFATNLQVPTFFSTEEAVEWGWDLNPNQYATLIEAQRALSDTALGESDLQRKVDLATQSQLMREAADAFAEKARKLAIADRLSRQT
jgi:hypothetical protein